MAIVSIAITECEYDVATLRVLRSYTHDSMSVLRAKLGTREPAVFLTTDDSPMFDVRLGLRTRHATILAVCHKLAATGAVLDVGLAAREGAPFETVDVEKLPALFEREIEQYGLSVEELARIEAEEAAANK